MLFRSLLSIPRDTRVAIDGHGFDKINHAYAFGGHKLTQQTVERLLDVPIDHYIVIDIKSFERIIDAIGSTNAKLKIDSVDIALNKTKIVEHSLGLDFDEEALKEKLKSDEIIIDVELNNGDFKGQAWGCDLTYKYVQINASYRS